VRASLVLIAVAVAMLISGTSRADDVGSGEDIDLRARVAILPMLVNSTGEQAYLRTGLSDMLASRLGRNPLVAVVRVEADRQATTDPVRAASIGNELGAQFVVFGSFTQFGEGASLDVQCIEVGSYEAEDEPEARRIFIQSGTVGEIIPKLDETAEKIGRFVAAPMPAAAPPAVAAPAAQAGPTVDPAEVEGLRRRVEAIEAHLFGSKDEEVSVPEFSEGTASDFGPR